MRWICCQLGAREHYAVPRALRLHHALDSMVTDAWVAPGNVLGNFRRGLRERFHDDLADARVRHSTLRLLTFEAWARIRGLRGWERILARNEWFQQQAAKRLRDYGTAGPGDCVLFGYSYAAKDIFRLAKRRGWRTVLGQIDPGPPEERIVAQLHSENAGPRADGQIAPPVYWEHWREECALADRIVVNSPWSERALIEEGVPPEKLRVVPLAYEPPAEAAGFSRQYPERFTSQRPMRVLFLGQVNVRKGMGPLLEAIRQLLTDRPHPSPLSRRTGEGNRKRRERATCRLSSGLSDPSKSRCLKTSAIALRSVGLVRWRVAQRPVSFGMQTCSSFRLSPTVSA